MLLVNDETAVRSNGRNISVVYLSVLYVFRSFYLYRYDQVRMNILVRTVGTEVVLLRHPLLMQVRRLTG